MRGVKAKRRHPQAWVWTVGIGSKRSAMMPEDGSVHPRTEGTHDSGGPACSSCGLQASRLPEPAPPANRKSELERPNAMPIIMWKPKSEKSWQPSSTVSKGSFRAKVRIRQIRFRPLSAECSRACRRAGALCTRRIPSSRSHQTTSSEKTARAAQGALHKQRSYS